MTNIFGKHQSPINIQNPIKSELPDLEFYYKSTRCKPFFNNYSIQVNYHAGSILKVGEDHVFKLLQFHFHTPAEHSFDGKNHPMIIHFVHSGENDFYAVVAVIVDEGDENIALKAIMDNLDREITFDANNLLPMNVENYYYYHGSLTTPPYSENVHWIILRKGITASKKQIKFFESYMRQNARELQPSFNRVVKYKD